MNNQQILKYLVLRALDNTAHAPNHVIRALGKALHSEVEACADGEAKNVAISEIDQAIEALNNLKAELAWYDNSHGVSLFLGGTA